MRRPLGLLKSASKRRGSSSPSVVVADSTENVAAAVITRRVGVRLFSAGEPGSNFRNIVSATMTVSRGGDSSLYAG